MSLKIYGLARVLRKSKTTIKNKKVYVRLTLCNIKDQKKEAVIDSICFKSIDQKKQIQDIRRNSIIYIEGKLELFPKRIISSSFATVDAKDKIKIINSDSINNKLITSALKKAQENINIRRK